jgi:signal transduction histidine kinase
MEFHPEVSETPPQGCFWSALYFFLGISVFLVTKQPGLPFLVISGLIALLEGPLGVRTISPLKKHQFGVACYTGAFFAMFFAECRILQFGLLFAGAITAGLAPIRQLIGSIRTYLTSLNADRWVDFFGLLVLALGGFLLAIGMVSGIVLNLSRTSINIGVWSGSPSGFFGLLLFLGIGLFLIVVGLGIRQRAVWAGALGLCMTFYGFLNALGKAFADTQGDLSRIPEGLVKNSLDLFLNWGFFIGFYSVFYPTVSSRARDLIGPLEGQLEQIRDALQTAQDRLTRAEDQAAQTSRDLAFEKAKYQAVFESINEGVIIFTADSTLLYMNPAFGTQFNVTFKDWEGKPFAPLFERPGIEKLRHSHSSPEPEFSAKLASKAVSDPALETISASETASVPVSAPEFDLPTPDSRGQLIVRDDQGGVRRWLSFYTKPISRGPDEAPVFIGLYRDITFEKEIDRMKTEFVSNVSHELRTPLTSIRAYTEMLLDDEAEDPQTRKDYLQIILDEAERLTNLINDILDLSRMESGKKAYRFGEHDPAALLKKVAAVAASFADQKHQQLTLTLPEPSGNVMCDPDLLHQSVLNLVNNALKYTPAEGRITIALSWCENHYQITVSDTGPGIAPEDQRRLFSKFFRVETSLNREIGGTGLGLALVKQIALVHQGEVTVASEIGKGSTFTLSLPRHFSPPG